MEAEFRQAGFTDLQIIRKKYDIGDWRGGTTSPSRSILLIFCIPISYTFLPCILVPPTIPENKVLSRGVSGLLSLFRYFLPFFRVPFFRARRHTFHRIFDYILTPDERTAAASRAAQNAMSTATLGAHEIVRHVYPDEQSRKDFLEKVGKDWYNRDYHVYLWLYLPSPCPSPQPPCPHYPHRRSRM